MIHNSSLFEINRLEKSYLVETSNFILLGSQIKTIDRLRDFLKRLNPRLIFLDLSMHFPPVKIDINNKVFAQNSGKFANYSQDALISQTIEITNEFWEKTIQLFEDCRSVLNEEGFFAVKVNGAIKASLKYILDKIFGIEKWVNEILIDSPFKVFYTPNSEVFERTNFILLYTRSSKPRINPVLNEKESGGYWHSFVSKGQGSPKKFIFKDIGEITLAPPAGTHWKLKQKTILKFCEEGKIRLNKNGNPEYWVPLKKGQIIDSNWLDINSFNWDYCGRLTNSSNLYNRLLKSFLNKEDLFFDLSADIGVSLIVANNLRINWIGLAENPDLISTCMKNLTHSAISFSVYKNSEPNSSSDSPSYSYFSNDQIHKSEFTSPFENSLDLIESYTGTTQEDSLKWMNMLIHGDCRDVIPLLNPELQQQVKVIYIDPPFFVGSDENIVIPIGLSKERFLLPAEDLAYKNVLQSSNPVEFFQKWFKERVFLMKSLLRKDGFIFVRFDYHFGHYAKKVLDEVFGSKNFVNEFIVRRMKKNLSQKQAYRQTHLIVHSDSVFLYQRSSEAKLKPFLIQKRKRKGQDLAERQYVNDNLWIDIAGYEKAKKTLFPTENSETLLSRIIKISSEEGDIIADFFSGSGTTVAIAEKLKRKWVGVDIGSYSIHEIKKRILKIPNHSLFSIFQAEIISENTTSKIKLKNDCSQTLPVAEFRIKINGKNVEISIDGFKPSKQLEISNSYTSIDFIDFWAIDWNSHKGAFKASWHSFRELKGKQVLNRVNTSVTHNYLNSGNYMVAVIIVDIFGINTRQCIDINIL